MKGSISDFSSPVVNLQFNPQLDLNAIAQAAHLSAPIRGSLVGTIQADGKFENLQLDARIKGTDINAGHYRNADFDLRGRAEWGSKKVLIRDMEIDSAAWLPAWKRGIVYRAGSKGQSR